MNLSHPDHPIWSLIRLFLICLFATGILYITATEFDATEWKAIGGIGVGAAVVEGIRRVHTAIETKEEQ